MIKLAEEGLNQHEDGRDGSADLHEDERELLLHGHGCNQFLVVDVESS